MYIEAITYKIILDLLSLLLEVFSPSLLLYMYWEQKWYYILINCSSQPFPQSTAKSIPLSPSLYTHSSQSTSQSTFHSSPLHFFWKLDTQPYYNHHNMINKVYTQSCKNNTNILINNQQLFAHNATDSKNNNTNSYNKHIKIDSQVNCHQHVTLFALKPAVNINSKI